MGQQFDLVSLQRYDDLIDGNLVEPGRQRIIAAHVAHTKTRFFDSGQIAVHDKAVVGVVLERTQIERGGFTAAHQKDMAQTQPLAAAGAVYPAQDHTLDHDACRAEDVEQRQYDTGVVVQVHQIQSTNEDQQSRRVDDGNLGAALGQAAQPRGAVDTGDPVDEHEHQRRGQPGNDVARVPCHGQRRPCAARLKVADVIETDIVGKQKADEKQCRVRQHIQKAFEALVLFQQEVMPSLR